MAIHHEVLLAARRLCHERGAWSFRVSEIVTALPHLNERSIRTHVVSRCCVNAPQNHPHRWDYFRRIDRGVYEIRPPWRQAPADRDSRQGASPRSANASAAVAETRRVYAARRRKVLGDTIHAVVRRAEGVYVGECLEVAVVTQGRSLDELVGNLREAIELHLEGEDLPALGLSAALRIAVLFEFEAGALGAQG